MKAILTSLLVAASAFAEIRTETVTVTMRDGVKLTADIYRDDAVPQAPAIQPAMSESLTEPPR
jgi:predicted acyl esterase